MSAKDKKKAKKAGKGKTEESPPIVDVPEPPAADADAIIDVPPPPPASEQPSDDPWGFASLSSKDKKKKSVYCGRRGYGQG